MLGQPDNRKSGGGAFRVGLEDDTGPGGSHEHAAVGRRFRFARKPASSPPRPHRDQLGDLFPAL